MQKIKPGRYRHFKGNEYEVLFTATDSETEEAVVVYRALYGEHKIWVRPASMWNETVNYNGEIVSRFAYVPPAHYLHQIREYLMHRGIITDDSIVAAVGERQKGKYWLLADHIRALVYSQLTNQTKWSRIVMRLQEIDQLFFDYDPERIKNTPADYFTQGLFSLKCGNISTKRQMDSLAGNIAVFEHIEKEYGSMDAFVTSENANAIVEKLSRGNSPYKLSMVGEALAWEYIRNVGIDGAKPDTHVRRFLGANRMGNSAGEEASIEESLVQIDRLSAETGMNKAEIDGLIWHFCADGYGEICTALPHCDLCPIRDACHYE